MTSSSHSGDTTSHLTTLGTGSLISQFTEPSASMLESFPNRFPQRPYMINMAYPEYTSLCPVTGQPDFGTIVLEYIPNALCVESKSFKLYMFAYRNHQAFMESLTNIILEDVVSVLSPHWCRVKGLFAPRGGTHIHVFAEQYAKPDDAAIRLCVNEWKQQVPQQSW